RNRSVCSTASREESTEFLYWTSPMAARIEMSEITINSSTSVNPASRRAPCAAPPLPVLVFRPIESLAFRLRVDVEHAAAAPRGRVGPVRIGAHAPVGRVRHRIDRDAAQKLELDAGRIVVLG